MISMRIGKKTIVILIILIFAPTSMTFGKVLIEEGHISGFIKDSRGVPLRDVLITLVQGTFNPKIIKEVTTNGFGKYEIKDLLPGSYSLKVSLASYLPILKPGIKIVSGQLAQLNLSLQSLYNKSFPSSSTSETSVNKDEDIRSVLRTASSNRPILRILETNNNQDLKSMQDVFSKRHAWENAFYIYSKAYSPNPRNLDIGQVFTKFALKRNITGNSQWLMDGTFSDSGFTTFNSIIHLNNLNGHNPSMRISLGMIPYLNKEKFYHKHQQKLNLVNLDFQDKLNFTKFMSIVYGMEFQSGNPLLSFQKVRPRLGFQIQPLKESKVSFFRTNSTPHFNRTFTLSKQEKLSLVLPLKEEFHDEIWLGQIGVTHTEIKVDQKIHNNSKLILRAYSDNFSAQSQTSNIDLTGLTPVSSRGLSITYRKTSDSGLQTNLGYTFGGGSKYSMGSKELVPKNYHLMVAGIEAQIRSSQTTIATTYRWISGVSITIVDPYEELYKSSAPGFNVMLGQVIPYWERMFPGELEAQIDLRNLFQNEKSDSFDNLREMMHYEFFQPSKSLRGGIRLKF